MDSGIVANTEEENVGCVSLEWQKQMWNSEEWLTQKKKSRDVLAENGRNRDGFRNSG